MSSRAERFQNLVERLYCPSCYQIDIEPPTKGIFGALWPKFNHLATFKDESKALIKVTLVDPDMPSAEGFRMTISELDYLKFIRDVDHVVLITNLHKAALPQDWNLPQGVILICFSDLLDAVAACPAMQKELHSFRSLSVLDDQDQHLANGTSGRQKSIVHLHLLPGGVKTCLDLVFKNLEPSILASELERCDNKRPRDLSQQSRPVSTHSGSDIAEEFRTSTAAPVFHFKGQNNALKPDEAQDVLNVAQLAFDGDGLLGRNFESKDITLYPRAEPIEIPSLLSWSRPLSEKEIPELPSQSDVEYFTPSKRLRIGGQVPKSQESTQDKPLLQDSQANGNPSLQVETSQRQRQQPVERSFGSTSRPTHDVPSKAIDGHNSGTSSVPAEMRPNGGTHSLKSYRSPSSFKHDDSSTDTRKHSPEFSLRPIQRPLRKARVRLPPNDSRHSPVVKRVTRTAENCSSTDADAECLLRSYEFDRESKSPPPLSPALLPAQGRPAAVVRLPKSSSSAPPIQPSEAWQDYPSDSTWDHDSTRNGGTTGHSPAHLTTSPLRQLSPSPSVMQGLTQRSLGDKKVHMSLRQYGHRNTDNAPCENLPTITTGLSTTQTGKQLESTSVLVLPQKLPKISPTNEQGARQRAGPPFLLPPVPAPEKDGNRIIRTFTIANLSPSGIEATKTAEPLVASIQSPSNNEAARPAASNASESPLHLGQDEKQLVETCLTPSLLPPEKGGARLARELDDLQRHLGDVITDQTRVVLSTSRRGKPCRLFEDICYESLKYIFDKELDDWGKEVLVNDKSGKVDAIATINSKDRFYKHLKLINGSMFLVFEFKFYKDQLKPDLIYKTIKYLYPTAGRGTVVMISPRLLHQNALRETQTAFRDRKIVLHLTTDTLCELLKARDEDKSPCDTMLKLLNKFLYSRIC